LVMGVNADLSKGGQQQIRLQQELDYMDLISGSIGYSNLIMIAIFTGLLIKAW